jgi:hypothetical protein
MTTATATAPAILRPRQNAVSVVIHQLFNTYHHSDQRPTGKVITDRQKAFLLRVNVWQEWMNCLTTTDASKIITAVTETKAEPIIKGVAATIEAAHQTPTGKKCPVLAMADQLRRNHENGHADTRCQLLTGYQVRTIARAGFWSPWMSCLTSREAANLIRAIQHKERTEATEPPPALVNPAVIALADTIETLFRQHLAGQTEIYASPDACRLTVWQEDFIRRAGLFEDFMSSLTKTEAARIVAAIEAVTEK